MRQEAINEAIRKCFLFSEAESQTVLRIAKASQVVRYQPGETLFETGDAADGLRIILSGLVRVWISNEGGKELTLSLLEP